MDYFQGVVTEYLRADRAMFVNTECLLQLEPGDVPAKGRHWYCDALAANFRESRIYLCEVSYSATLQSLLGRLAGWRMHWPALIAALHRDCGLPLDWHVFPWVFIPSICHPVLTKKLDAIPVAVDTTTTMPRPRVTLLESVTPWNYKTWDRRESKIEGDE
jgi:hypothetical protein